MARQIRESEPRGDTPADSDCVYIARQLYRRQWGYTHVCLEWSERRQVLEATIFMKLPVWRYKFSHMAQHGGESVSTERSDTEVWQEFYLTQAKIGKPYRPSKGNWIHNFRFDVELDVNDTKEMWVDKIDEKFKEEFSTPGQFLSYYFHGPLDSPYPAPKMSSVDWDWEEGR